jgi:ppGpp synthetase/RelA/SpoT-type nucleotidyltranferase
MNIEDLYPQIEPLLHNAKNITQSIVASYASHNGFLFSIRIKDAASLRDKLQTGRFRRLTDVDDLVACSIIFDTRNQEKDALAFVRSRFNVVRVNKGRSISDERIFDFDCTRVTARLALTDHSSPLGRVNIEIQLRTILEHAWSKITHPLVYKPKTIDARRIRLAAETMAHVEALDRSFSRFRTVTKGVKRIEKPRTSDLNQVSLMFHDLCDQGLVRRELRPTNVRRLSENVIGVSKRGSSVSAVISAVRDFVLSEGSRLPISANLFEISVIALKRANLLENERNKARPILISDSLASLYPDALQISYRVELDTFF